MLPPELMNIVNSYTQDLKLVTHVRRKGDLQDKVRKLQERTMRFFKGHSTQNPLLINLKTLIIVEGNRKRWTRTAVLLFETPEDYLRRNPLDSRMIAAINGTALIPHYSTLTGEERDFLVRLAR